MESAAEPTGPESNPYRVVVDDRRADERDVFMSYTPTIVQLEGSDIVWLAGTTALPLYHAHPHTEEDVANLPPDAYEQTKLALAGVERQLESAGAVWSDLVRLSVFIADIAQNGPGVSKALGEVLGPWFPHPQGIGLPGGSMIGVDQLIDKDNIVELEGIAVLPPARRVAVVEQAASQVS